MPATYSKVFLWGSSGEVTWGSTAGTASKKLHGLTDASLTINTQVEVTEAVGWIGPSAIAAEVSQSGEGTIEGTLVYEDAPNLLNGVFTAVAAGSSSTPYSYWYTAPTNATQACYTYCIEYGTTANNYKALGSILNGINIKGEAGQSWKFSIPILAKQILSASTQTTGANVDRTVNPVRMQDTTLSVDLWSTSAFGTTPLSATLISFELDVPAGRHLKQFAGSKFPGDWGEGRMNGSLALVLEFTATAKSYVDAMLGSAGAELQKHIRLHASQNSSSQAFNIDFAGIQSEPVKLWDDRDGNMTVALKFAGKNSTGLASGNWLQLQAVMGSSSST